MLLRFTSDTEEPQNHMKGVPMKSAMCQMLNFCLVQLA